MAFLNLSLSFYDLIIKNHIPEKDRTISEINEIKIICESLVNKGVLIEKGKGKFAYIESPAPKQTNVLEMMWDFAEHKTNKKLTAMTSLIFMLKKKIQKT
jgi:hypothetical protein